MKNKDIDKIMTIIKNCIIYCGVWELNDYKDGWVVGFDEDRLEDLYEKIKGVLNGTING